MKKPIKEVMEKASKGPFEWRQTSGMETGLDVLVTDSSGRGIAWAYAQNDAQLIAHWLNHGPQLLEAFERFITSVADEGGFNGSFSGADEALKAASEVEVE